MNRLRKDAFSTSASPGVCYVGADLSDEDLDALYRSQCLGEEVDHRIVDWWADKSHQVLHRMLKRLARAEMRLERAKNTDDGGGWGDDE